MSTQQLFGVAMLGGAAIVTYLLVGKDTSLPTKPVGECSLHMPHEASQMCTCRTLHSLDAFLYPA